MTSVAVGVDDDGRQWESELPQPQVHRHGHPDPRAHGRQPGRAGARHGERLRLQLHFKYADTDNLSLLAVNALAVHVLAVHVSLRLYIVSKRVFCTLHSLKKYPLHTT